MYEGLFKTSIKSIKSSEEAMLRTLKSVDFKDSQKCRFSALLKVAILRTLKTGTVKDLKVAILRPLKVALLRPLKVAILRSF